MDRVTQLLNELYINGFAVMEDAIPIPTIERIHASFLPMLEHVRHREHELGHDERGDIRVGCGRLQHPARVTMQWPWEGGLACPEIAENPTLLALLEAYWETDDFLVTCLHSNTPYPGSIHQNWHRDIKLMAPHVAMERVPHFGSSSPWSTPPSRTAASRCCRRRSSWPTRTWKATTTTSSRAAPTRTARGST